MVTGGTMLFLKVFTQMTKDIANCKKKIKKQYFLQIVMIHPSIIHYFKKIQRLKKSKKQRMI